MLILSSKIGNLYLSRGTAYQSIVKIIKYEVTRRHVIITFALQRRLRYEVIALFHIQQRNINSADRVRSVNWRESWIHGGSTSVRRSRKTRCNRVLSRLPLFIPSYSPSLSLSPSLGPPLFAMDRLILSEKNNETTNVCHTRRVI